MAKNDLSHDQWPEVDQPFETEDEDLCPLCMEELDISDLNFRPCPCGYRICRFCWHHIKEDLNRRCPGCRKEYDDSVVEFKPMKAEELKRLQQAKKQRDKERKDQELVNRKHLANVRVKQKNQVHVQGLTTKIANEDTLAQLKTSELFSQYGRIQKMFMSRRTGSTNLYTPDPRYQHVNLYINFTRNTEALACIQGIDGSTLPDGHRLKASLGSTKYCASFLRGLKCTNDNCTGAHELAEEVEGGGTAAREEMSTARHAQKESEHRHPSKTHFSATSHHPSASASAHPVPSGVALPATASWANKSSSTSQPASPAPAHAHALSPQPGPSNGIITSKHLAKGPLINPAKSTHPLPLKPRPRSSEGIKTTAPGSSTDTEPSHALSHSRGAVATIGPPKTAGPSQEPGLGNHPQGLPLHGHQIAQQDPGKAQGTNGPPDLAQTANMSRASPKSLSHPISANSHPPGLFPPGLTAHHPSSGSAPTAPASRPVPSLPPGLLPPKNSSHGPTLWQTPFDINGSLSSKAPEKVATDPLSPSFDVLSTFSPNFGGSRMSIFGDSVDGTFGSSRALGPTGYSGTFNPFADTDFPLSTKDTEGLFGMQPDSTTPRPEHPLSDRRGSRFGFARRESVGAGVAVGESSAPLRSIFSHQAGEGSSPKAAHQAHQLGRSAPLSRPQEPLHLVSSVPDDSTPDASVLFPGVNLAASYSANALPAAIARGVRSPGVAGHQGHEQAGPYGAHPRDVGAGRANERLAFVGRQAALSPTFTPIHHDHLLRAERFPGQFQGPAELGEFQDPAILNIRMANNVAGGYLGQGANEHDIHQQFSINNGGFHGMMNSARTAGGTFGGVGGGPGGLQAPPPPPPPQPPQLTQQPPQQEVGGLYGFQNIGRGQGQYFLGGAGGLLSGSLQRDGQRQHR